MLRGRLRGTSPDTGFDKNPGHVAHSAVLLIHPACLSGLFAANAQVAFGAISLRDQEGESHMAAKKSTSSKAPPKFRRADTGRYTTPAYANKHPKTTVKESK
jgi:hypothetical protein